MIQRKHHYSAKKLIQTGVRCVSHLNHNAPVNPLRAHLRLECLSLEEVSMREVNTLYYSGLKRKSSVYLLGAQVNL